MGLTGFWRVFLEWPTISGASKQERLVFVGQRPACQRRRVEFFIGRYLTAQKGADGADLVSGRGGGLPRKSAASFSLFSLSLESHNRRPPSD